MYCGSEANFMYPLLHTNTLSFSVERETIAIPLTCKPLQYTCILVAHVLTYSLVSERIGVLPLRVRVFTHMNGVCWTTSGVEELMKWYPDLINKPRKDGYTPLHIVAANRHTDILTVLASHVCSQLVAYYCQYCRQIYYCVYVCNLGLNVELHNMTVKEREVWLRLQFPYLAEKSFYHSVG